MSGNTAYTKEDITGYIERKYVPLGTLKSRIDCDSLEENLRQQYEELGWVSCSLQGCRLAIIVKESLEDKMEQNATKPCDLIAFKDGVITSIITENGTPLFKKGDKVKKGETLITGNVNIYSDNHELLETHKVIAAGEVWARTKVPYSATYQRTYYKKNYKKKTSSVYGAYICGRRLPFMPDIRQTECVDVVVENHYMALGKTYYLPVWLEHKKYRKYIPEKVTRTKQEAEAYAKRRIQKQMEQWEEMGIRVLSTNIQIKTTEEICTASGYFLLEEPITKIRTIQKLTEEQEKKIRPTEEVLW